ncbi:MAG: enoyl-[acyl-carrier-protein] reductase FabK [Clostridia bacterium]|nr:enoyl-[acyl-carrier-protein] reductase FabK [Clostridia bacterium]
MLKTPLCNLLGIEYPIIQGGMAWVATAELAAAVSEAGGLGLIGAGHAPADWVQGEIRKIKAVTKKPFGINVMLLSPFVKEVMDVIIEERVPVVTTGAGNPGTYMAALKEVGCKVVPLVPSIAMAKRMARVGADAVIAEGTESGGHVGELTTMALVPQVVDCIDIPVIAAGGIHDGRGFVAALALGAVGVQMGTRFMCASECTIHSSVKEVILKAKDRDTVVTGRSTGHPVRCIRNKFTRQLEQMEAQCVPAEEIEKMGVGRMKICMIDGDVQNGSLMAGQIASMVDKIEPARDIIQDIMQGAAKILSNLEVNR